MSQVMLYVTAGSHDEAVAVGRAVVEARLAACANIGQAITSLFWWEGAVQEEAEFALILKTREDLVDAVVAKVKEVHSYDCPCVVALPMAGGNPEFLDWIDSQTNH